MAASQRIVLRSVLWLFLTLGMCHGRVKMVEMSHKFGENNIFWPGVTKYIMNILFEGFIGGEWYQIEEMQSGTHVGTHIDAPCHSIKDSWCIDEIPIEHFIAPGVFIDIRKKVRRNPDAQLTLDDVKDWESKHGRMPKGAVVFQCSGWSDRYPDFAAVFGNDQPDESNFHFPGFHVKAVEWLIKKRNIIGIAVDTPSVDYGPSQDYIVHLKTAAKNVYGLESVKNTCEVPEQGSTVYVFPSNLEGSSGAPVRIIATWRDKD